MGGWKLQPDIRISPDLQINLCVCVCVCVVHVCVVHVCVVHVCVVHVCVVHVCVVHVCVVHVCVVHVCVCGACVCVWCMCVCVVHVCVCGACVCVWCMCVCVVHVCVCGACVCVWCMCVCVVHVCVCGACVCVVHVCVWCVWCMWCMCACGACVRVVHVCVWCMCACGACGACVRVVLACVRGACVCAWCLRVCVVLVCVHGAEVIFVEINLRKTKFLLLEGYRPPSQSNQYFFDNINHAMDLYRVTYDKIFLTGDFNAKVSESCLSDFLYENDLKCIVKENTCFKNLANPICVDLFLTNFSTSFQNTMVVCTGLSDFHKMIIINVLFQKLRQKLYIIGAIKISMMNHFDLNSRKKCQFVKIMKNLKTPTCQF